MSKKYEIKKIKDRRVIGWQNVDKLYAEYKQVIQKIGIEYL